MLLTLTSHAAPATDLGYLLHKHPARVQVFELSLARAHVFYPEATAERCTAALLLDVDPIGWVRGRRGPAGEAFLLAQYVNDRPYVASSLLSVAIAQVFGSALAGKCHARPELVETVLPLTARISVLPCRGGEAFLRRLFEPLGYKVHATRHALDQTFPEWGESVYHTVELSGVTTVQSLLGHLYVLVPVLDNDKHYWIGRDEIDKLLRHGRAWLSDHPEKEAIVERYLKRQRHLMNEALARLLEGETAPDEEPEAQGAQEATVEAPLRLNDVRLECVVSALKAAGAKRVLDLGCSTGNLLKRLVGDRAFEEIVGVDVSHRALEIAAERLKLDRMPAKQRERIRLVHGSLTYRDRRLEGFDAAAIVEVIEHFDPARLAAFERVVFEFARPATVVVTTPNVEYNVHFPSLAAGGLRHKDHRFEWTRGEFGQWSERIFKRFGYRARLAGIGPEDPATGPPTQMAVFTSNP
jgi:3' terminal RNA ribose 2'-O-methyltransferase Hen1